MKTMKSRLFKKYLKTRKSRALLFASWFAKKSVVIGAHKVGKVIDFWPLVGPHFHIILTV